MRWLIAVVVLFGLSAGEARAAASITDVICGPYQTKWDSLGAHASIASVESFVKSVPANCPVHATALRRLDEMKHPAPPRPKPSPGPKPDNASSEPPPVALPPMPIALSPPVAWTAAATPPPIEPSPRETPPTPDTSAPVVPTPAPTPVVSTPAPTPAPPPVVTTPAPAPVIAATTVEKPPPPAPPPTPVLTAKETPREPPPAPTPAAITPAPAPIPVVTPEPTPAPPPSAKPVVAVATETPTPAPSPRPAPLPPPPPPPASTPSPAPVELKPVGPFKNPAAQKAQAAKDEAEGEADYGSKQLALAEAYLNRAREEGLDTSANHYWLGRIHLDQGKPRTAIEDFGAAILAAPDDSAGDQRRAYLQRAVAYYAVEQYNQTQQDLERYKDLADRAKDAPGYLFYAYNGKTELALGDNAEAAASFGQALTFQPDDRASFFGQGVADARLDNYGNAIKELREAERLAEQADALDFQTLYFLAIVEFLGGDKTAAGTDFAKAEKYDDGSMKERVQCLVDDVELPSMVMRFTRLTAACKNVDAKHELLRPVR